MILSYYTRFFGICQPLLLKKYPSSGKAQEKLLRFSLFFSQSGEMPHVLFVFRLFRGLDGVFVTLNHLLNHLSADAACLTGGQVTVVTVLKIYANLAGSLHFKLFHCSLCFGNHCFVCSHIVSSPVLNVLICSYTVRSNKCVQICFFEIYLNETRWFLVFAARSDIIVAASFGNMKGKFYRLFGKRRKKELTVLCGKLTKRTNVFW